MAKGAAKKSGRIFCKHYMRGTIRNLRENKQLCLKTNRAYLSKCVGL